MRNNHFTSCIDSKNIQSADPSHSGHGPKIKRLDFCMTTIHNLGFPRIGAKRELKFALESYWRGETSRDALKALGAELRQRHWTAQQELDWVPVGDSASTTRYWT